MASLTSTKGIQHVITSVAKSSGVIVVVDMSWLHHKRRRQPEEGAGAGRGPGGGRGHVGQCALPLVQHPGLAPLARADVRPQVLDGRERELVTQQQPDRVQ